MIARRRILLLVTHVVLFIHNDQPQIAERHKQCGTRAQNEFRLALFQHFVPYFNLFLRIETRMIDQQRIAEKMAQTVHHKIGQRNFADIDRHRAKPAAGHDHKRQRLVEAQLALSGTLPGAINLDSDLFFEPGSAALMDKAQLASEAAALHARPGQATVAFCNTGHWAATDWFVLSEVLGRPGVQLYPGSMVAWTQSPEPLPMANEPSRWAQLRYQWMNWSHRNLGTQAP